MTIFPPLDWQSDLSAELVFSAGESFSYPTPLGNSILYLTALKQEGSRQALMLDDGNKKQCLSPQPFNLATRISEYGGKPFWLHDDRVVFANREDQCLYAQSINSQEAGQPERLTSRAENGVYMYAELATLNAETAVAIAEQEISGSENLSFLVSLDLTNTPCEPDVVQRGADFYSNLVVDAQHQRMAWVEWNHPHMPWDNNQLIIADYQIKDGRVNLSEPTEIRLESDASFCQLCFANNGRLFFSADRQGQGNNGADNFWNLYAADISGKRAEITAVSSLQQEFGYPHWQYGDQRIVQFDDQRLVTIGSSKESDSLYFVDQETLQLHRWRTVDGRLHSLASDRQGCSAMIEQPLLETAKVVTLQAGRLHTHLSNPALVSANELSAAKHLEFKTRDGETAYGYYYAPKNSNYDQATEPPPLLVMVHGGPTARAYGCFDIQKQFWTNRGFAVFDVNHRGSSGYGRQFRDALYGNWGVMDSNDIVDGIRYLMNEGLAHPAQICIRGKSAGGYAVLCALTQHPEIFRAGACYYGIGNLATLAEITHKFEKYYTDRLIGEQYDAANAASSDSQYYKRSPVHQIDRISSAMIIFQGSQDKVVPPQLAREMVVALERSEIDHQYVEYSDEGHGFRQVDNNMDSINKEFEFYREVLSS